MVGERMVNNSLDMLSCILNANNKGLAIGNLTSQCFANFYMYFFDDFMSTMFKFYGRYVDDYFVIAETK